MTTLATSPSPGLSRARYAGGVLLLGVTWLVATGVLMSQAVGSNGLVVAVLTLNAGLWMLLSRPRAQVTGSPWPLLTAPVGAVGLYWVLALATAYWTQPGAHPAWVFPVGVVCALAWASWTLATVYYCFAQRRRSR